MEEKLKKWQVIYIDNIKYVVINMIEFKEEEWKWQEYELKNNENKHIWLSIEKDEYHKIKYSIHTPYYETISMSEKNIKVNGQDYELHEQGTATVTNFFGNVDVDI